MGLHVLKAHFLLVSLETPTTNHALLDECFKKNLPRKTMDNRKIYRYIILEAKFSGEFKNG